jgi:formyl-CoA transferase
VMSLLHRERNRSESQSGPGQVVDVAIYEAVLTLMESLLPDYQLGEHTRGRTGSVLPNVAPSNLYETADGTLVLIAANADAPFRRLADVMGRSELATDPRYATHTARGEHAAELDELIGQWTRRHKAAALVDLLAEHGVPAGQIYTAAEMLTDPHFAAREAILTETHPTLGEFPMQAPCPRLSGSPGSVRSLGPDHGAHDQEVFGDLLGLSTEELERLRLDGIVASPPMSLSAPSGRERGEQR